MLSHDKKYKVRKTELLAKLRTNRAKHIETFEAAKEEYRKQLLGAMRSVIVTAEAGARVELTPVRKLLNSPPRQHIKDYDQVIGLLDFTTDETIEITPADFRTYVMDEWGWRGEFVASTANYLNSREGVEEGEPDEHDKW